MVNVAVIGIGDWGRNLVSCFDELADVTHGCHSGDAENET